MTNNELMKQFNDLLIQIVAYNTKCKGAIEGLEKQVSSLNKQIGNSDTKSVMGELEKIDTKILTEAQKFLTTFTKRNYSEQEIKDLGGHVEQVDALYKMGKWFKSKLAIFIGVVLTIIAVTTFGEKITALLEIIGLIGP